MAARKFRLDEAGHAQVSAAVARAEAQSNGEIVTILAERSDHYGDIALYWAGGATLLALSLLAAFPDLFVWLATLPAGGWSAGPTVQGALTTAFAAALLTFLSVWLILQWPPLRLILTPRDIKTNRVHARAIDLFRVGAEARTMGRTGILIYLSMRERRAEIVADEAIARLVPDTIWGDILAPMLDGVRAGQPAEAMAAAVDAVGLLLARHFPKGEADSNELPDRLIEL